MKTVTTQDKNRHAKRGYNDEPERTALDRMIRDDQRCHDFICEYFSLVLDKNYHIQEDPFGNFDVDLAMRDEEDDSIVGLIEVDVFFAWDDTWPYYYKFCHRLERKMKYYIERPYPYVNFTFNTKHTSAIVTTREIEEKHLVRYDKPFVRQGHMDNVKEIPIEEALKFGEWVN